MLGLGLEVNGRVRVRGRESDVDRFRRGIRVSRALPSCEGRYGAIRVRVRVRVRIRVSVQVMVRVRIEVRFRVSVRVRASVRAVDTCTPYRVIVTSVSNATTSGAFPTIRVMVNHIGCIPYH